MYLLSLARAPSDGVEGGGVRVWRGEGVPRSDPEAVLWSS